MYQLQRKLKLKSSKKRFKLLHFPPRRPSQWLAPGVTAFTRMVSSSSTPMLRRTPEPLEEREPTPEKDADTQERQDKPRPLR